MWPLLTPGSLSPPVPHLDHCGDPLAESPLLLSPLTLATVHTSQRVPGKTRPHPSHFPLRQRLAVASCPLRGGRITSYPSLLALCDLARPPSDPQTSLLPPQGLCTGCSLRLEHPHPEVVSASLPSLTTWFRHNAPSPPPPAARHLCAVWFHSTCHLTCHRTHLALPFIVSF